MSLNRAEIGIQNALQKDMEKNYVEIIREEFLRRRSNDITYSIRKFAADLSLNEKNLGRILQGEKGLSKLNAFIVARRLGLGLREAKEFRFLVSAQSGRSKYERSLAKQWLKKKSVAAERSKS